MSVDTIYAVSSGRPPAAIAVMRISGDRAREVLAALAGPVPPPRMATLRTLRSRSGEALDRGLVLWFPAPASATGEDVAELHLHGGIAVVDAVARALASAGLRQAEAGEFTRRALLNGRIDLSEAEGLADLLAAETETQRREAMLRASGVLGRELDDWAERLLAISAEIERAIDHDEDDALQGVPDDVLASIRALERSIATALDRPDARRLRDGIRVAIVGPANAGKSSLFNALIGRDAAIVTAVPGTTRDVLERSVSIAGTPFVLIDTAGVRETADPIEQLGIARAHDAAEDADIVLDLGDDAQTAGRHIAIAAKADIRDRCPRGGHLLSVVTGQGLADLTSVLAERAAKLLPADDEFTIDDRTRTGLSAIADALRSILSTDDLVIAAEHLSAARRQIDRLTGRVEVESLLETLFARFCIGK